MGRGQLELGFGNADADQVGARAELGAGAVWLRGLALSNDEELLGDLMAVAHRAPFRHMVTPGGFTMSVAMTNCGPLGWVTDATGYRYSPMDPESGSPWPEMPRSFRALAQAAAQGAGYAGFEPDACLVNRYAPTARMSLHQDRNERDFSAPIVSVSLGLPATFRFGGANRSDPAQRVPLTHGDVVVWGGPSRLWFHGVAPLRDGHHALTGPFRYNLTFRKAA
ncbi:MAG: DNA oxidative demethylase AlkB [Myxococcota bacterium]